MTASHAALLIQGYLLAGFAFAIWFAARGAGRLDPIARSGTLGFRILLLPGATLLWPYLLARVMSRRSGPPADRFAHRIEAPEPGPR